MKKIFSFLASIYFALFLILSTIVLVTLATFIESYSKSHLLAAAVVYQNPLFTLLLWGYFVNILFSALKRFPFKRRHIPFLITHAGLLMVLAGCLLKSYFGLQGQMTLLEGESSSHIVIPKSYALQIEDRTNIYQSPIHKKSKRIATKSALSIELIEWRQHCEPIVLSWIKKGGLDLFGYPSIPLTVFDKESPPTGLNTPECTFFSLQANGNTLQTIGSRLQRHKPCVAFIETEENKQKLLTIDAEGQTHTKELTCDPIVLFDKGFSGYGLWVDLGEHFVPKELFCPLVRQYPLKKAPLAREEARPRIRLHVSQGAQSEVVTLAYDPNFVGLKQPILNGKYLACFRPKQIPIDHTVRLAQARKISYPGSNQPLAFESDCVIDGSKQTISMNKVHEAKDGTRFYMANLTSVHPLCAKQATLVVNWDPAKYTLTYPGAVLITLGALLLFFRKKYES